MREGQSQKKIGQRQTLENPACLKFILPNLGISKLLMVAKRGDCLRGSSKLDQAV